MNEPEFPPPSPLDVYSAHPPTQDERTWGMFAHLSAFSGYIGIPLGSFLGPLIVWLLKRDTSGYVAEQAKEALNFQISVLLYWLISIPLVLVFVGFALIFTIPILALVFTIIGTIKASEGVLYRYPLNIRFIR
jgi:uncharacterized Tic20 family protein